MSAITVYVLVIVLTCVLTAVIAQTNGDVRLVGSGNPRSGTLEVWYNGRYGGVCNDFFQSNAAKVVCRQLGFPTSSPVYSSERGQSAFYLDDVKCNGNEARISDCRHGQWGTSDCSDVEHINVTCSADPCRNDLCLNGGRCIQVLDANYRCNCPPGYHGSKCENETNECLTNNGGCSHVCVNTVGSYYCQCPDVELELGHDNHTCYAEGLNVVCTSDTMEVTFDKRYFRGMHGQYLTLRDTTCAAVDMPTQVKVTVPLEGCGTRFQQVGNAFVYENQVLSHTVPIQGLVTRVRDVNITVRCFYSINNTVDNFYYVDTGELHFTDHNQGTYQISMDLIHNGNVYHPTNSLPLSVEPGEKLSVKLSLQTNDSHLQVFARNCKATPTHTDQNTQQYLVLDNGCSTDPSLTMKNISDVSEEILSLETFKFLDNSSTLYFHCEVLVCNVSDPDSRCQQGCLRPGMGKRDAEMEDRDDDIYLSSQTLTVGPMEVNDKTQLATRTKKSDIGESEHHDPETNRATLAAGLALLGVVLIMVTVALSIIFKGDEEDKEIEKGDDMEKLLSNDE